MLNQKTELQKAMEKHKGKQIAKEQEREKLANLTPFQKALEQQALKLEQVTYQTRLQKLRLKLSKIFFYDHLDILFRNYILIVLKG